MEFLTKITSKYSVLSENAAKEQIMEEGKIFTQIIKQYLCENKLEKAKIVGLGNSLTSGWSATNKDIRPFILKLKELLQQELSKSGVPIEFYNYSILSNETNKDLFSFLASHPTESDVKKKLKGEQKEIDTAILNEFYPESDIELISCYGYNDLTISFLNCFMGKVFSSNENGQTFFDSLDEEEAYLRKIIQFLKYLKQGNEKNIITVGNFPFISTQIGKIMNLPIHSINKRIKRACEEKNVFYFNANQMAFIQRNENHQKLILDSHPRIDEQYTILYKYMKYLEEILSLKQNQRIRKR